jgi:acetoin utilization protein AcuB
MLVRDRMKQPVFTITSDMPIHEALGIMKRQQIRHIPVLQDGNLIGIVANEDLVYASPSPATSLSIWEMNYLLSKITVKEVMTEQVITVDEDTPIEDAALLMAENKIGSIPVMRNNVLVGIITETDLFNIFPELLAVHQSGVRATLMVKEEPGQLAKVTKVIADHGGNFISFVQFVGKDQNYRLVTIKVDGMTLEAVQTCLTPIVDKVVDIRKY